MAVIPDDAKIRWKNLYRTQMTYKMTGRTHVCPAGYPLSKMLFAVFSLGCDAPTNVSLCFVVVQYATYLLIKALVDARESLGQILMHGGF